MAEVFYFTISAFYGISIDFFDNLCYNVSSLYSRCVLLNVKTINNQIISDFKFLMKSEVAKNNFTFFPISGGGIPPFI